MPAAPARALARQGPRALTCSLGAPCAASNLCTSGPHAGILRLPGFCQRGRDQLRRRGVSWVQTWSPEVWGRAAAVAMWCLNKARLPPQPLGQAASLPCKAWRGHHLPTPTHPPRAAPPMRGCTPDQLWSRCGCSEHPGTWFCAQSRQPSLISDRHIALRPRAEATVPIRRKRMAHFAASPFGWLIVPEFTVPATLLTVIPACSIMQGATASRSPPLRCAWHAMQGGMPTGGPRLCDHRRGRGAGRAVRRQPRLGQILRRQGGILLEQPDRLVAGICASSPRRGLPHDVAAGGVRRGRGLACERGPGWARGYEGEG